MLLALLAALEAMAPLARTLPANGILPFHLPAPTKGPRLTASYTWNTVLNPHVENWPSESRLQLMKANLVSFISLNDKSDSHGDALILRSLRNARSSLET